MLRYDKAFSFSKEGIARVQINDKTGYIDTEGKMVIPFEYEEMSSFEDGKARAKKDGKWGLIDLSTFARIAER